MKLQPVAQTAIKALGNELKAGGVKIEIEALAGAKTLGDAVQMVVESNSRTVAKAVPLELNRIMASFIASVNQGVQEFANIVQIRALKLDKGVVAQVGIQGSEAVEAVELLQNNMGIPLTLGKRLHNIYKVLAEKAEVERKCAAEAMKKEVLSRATGVPVEKLGEFPVTFDDSAVQFFANVYGKGAVEHVSENKLFGLLLGFRSFTENLRDKATGRRLPKVGLSIIERDGKLVASLTATESASSHQQKFRRAMGFSKPESEQVEIRGLDDANVGWISRAFGQAYNTLASR